MRQTSELEQAEFERDVSRAAFNLGTTTGLLMRLSTIDPARADDLYAQLLSHLPMSQITNFVERQKRISFATSAGPQPAVQGNRLKSTQPFYHLPPLYTLDENRVAIPCDDAVKWSIFCETSDRLVASNVGIGYALSTAFIGVDLGHIDGEPKMFETMVTVEGGGRQILAWYSTWQEAQAGHDALLDQVDNIANLTVKQGRHLIIEDLN